MHACTHTQTDRQTDRQRQTETDRDRQRQTETDRDRQRQTETDRHTDIQTYIHTCIIYMYNIHVWPYTYIYIYIYTCMYKQNTSICREMIIYSHSPLPKESHPLSRPQKKAQAGTLRSWCCWWFAGAGLPSSKLTNYGKSVFEKYGKSPFLIGKSTISMAMFQS